MTDHGVLEAISMPSLIKRINWEEGVFPTTVHAGFVNLWMSLV